MALTMVLQASSRLIRRFVGDTSAIVRDRDRAGFKAEATWLIATVLP